MCLPALRRDLQRGIFLLNHLRMPGLDLQRPHGQRRQRQGLWLVRAGIVDSVSCGKLRSLRPAAPSLKVFRRKTRVPGERREKRRDVAVDGQVRRHLYSSNSGLWCSSCTALHVTEIRRQATAEDYGVQSARRFRWVSSQDPSQLHAWRQLTREAVGCQSRHRCSALASAACSTDGQYSPCKPAACMAHRQWCCSRCYVGSTVTRDD